MEARKWGVQGRLLSHSKFILCCTSGPALAIPNCLKKQNKNKQGNKSAGLSDSPGEWANDKPGSESRVLSVWSTSLPQSLSLRLFTVHRIISTLFTCRLPIPSHLSGNISSFQVRPPFPHLMSSFPSLIVTYNVSSSNFGSSMSPKPCPLYSQSHPDFLTYNRYFLIKLKDR